MKYERKKSFLTVSKNEKDFKLKVEALTNFELEPIYAGTETTAFTKITNQKFEFIVLDSREMNIDPVLLYLRIRNINEGLPMILILGDNDRKSVLQKNQDDSRRFILNKYDYDDELEETLQSIISGDAFDDELKNEIIDNVHNYYSERGRKTSDKNIKENQGKKKARRSDDKLHFLIIDDEEINRIILTEFLEDHFGALKIVVDEATGGGKGVALSNKKQYDVIFLDFMMPDLDGDETLRLIRLKYEKNELPVLAISSQDEMSNVKKLIQHGISDYIVRPIDFTVLIEKIKKCL